MKNQFNNTLIYFIEKFAVWLAEYKTIGEVVEAVATEQLLEVLSEDVRIC